MDSENYSIVQELVNKLQEKLEQNSKLKADIFQASKLLSLRGNPPHSAASSAAEFQYPKQFQSFQKTLPEEAQDKCDRITQLETEQQFLLQMITERETYNSILIETLNEYQLTILDMLQRLRSFTVEYNSDKLKDMQTKFDALQKMESDFYSHYLRLVKIKQMSLDIYQGVANKGLQDFFSNEEEIQVWYGKYMAERG